MNNVKMEKDNSWNAIIEIIEILYYIYLLVYI